MKRKTFRVLKGFLLLLGLAIAIISVLQLHEYRKLRSLLHPEGTPYKIEMDLPEFAKEIILNNRSAYLSSVSEEEISSWKKSISLSSLEQKIDAITAAEAVASLQSTVPPQKFMSLEDTDVELDFLFRYMKYSFAQYDYRGGDEVFAPLFEDIRNEIIKESIEGHILTEQYIGILQNRLLWEIQDRHSYIASRNHNEVFPENQYYSYTSDTFSFDIVDGNYIGNVDGKTVILLSVNNAEPDNYLKPGILEDGTITYIIWLYTNQEPDEISCILKLKDYDGHYFEKQVVLRRVVKYNADFDNLYSMTESDGYYYIRITALMSASKNTSMLNNMVSDAGKIRTNKPVIIDLRQNRGGNDYYALFWLLKFLDISKVQALNIPMPGISYDLNTQTINSLRKGKLAHAVTNPMLTERYKGGGGTALHVKNNAAIFVIIDRDCGSSGEWFTSYLSRLDNVVIVGENTKGMLMGGNQCTAILPISRYKATFSTSINLNSDMRDMEGIGLSPDLYVSPTDAVDCLIALIEKYKIYQ